MLLLLAVNQVKSLCLYERECFSVEQRRDGDLVKPPRQEEYRRWQQSPDTGMQKASAASWADKDQTCGHRCCAAALFRRGEDENIPKEHLLADWSRPRKAGCLLIKGWWAVHDALRQPPFTQAKLSPPYPGYSVIIFSLMTEMQNLFQVALIAEWFS